jgi:hypothetical protein
MIGHVAPEVLGHDLVDLLAKGNMIRVYGDDMLPCCSSSSWRPFNILEGLANLIFQRIRKIPIVIPTALT